MSNIKTCGAAFPLPIGSETTKGLAADPDTRWDDYDCAKYAYEQPAEYVAIVKIVLNT